MWAPKCSRRRGPFPRSREIDGDVHEGHVMESPLSRSMLSVCSVSAPFWQTKHAFPSKKTTGYISVSQVFGSSKNLQTYPAAHSKDIHFQS